MKTLTLGALLVAFPAFATTVIALDLPTMSREATAIVHGKVAKVEAKMSKSGRITTTATLEVSDALKGPPSTTTVEVVQPGGVVGDVGQRVAGTVKLAVGDEIVAFLEPRGPRFMLVGMAQGCFRVERSSDGAAAFAVQDREGHLRLLDPVTRAPVEPVSTPMKLEELKAKVRAVLEAPPAGTIDPRLPSTRPVHPESQK